LKGTAVSGCKEKKRVNGQSVRTEDAVWDKPAYLDNGSLLKLCLSDY